LDQGKTLGQIANEIPARDSDGAVHMVFTLTYIDGGSTRWMLNTPSLLKGRQAGPMILPNQPVSEALGSGTPQACPH
jgi:hypothetical protein